MSAERLRQAREQLRLEFIEYVEDLATGASDSDDIEHLVNLRQAIDALDHAIVANGTATALIAITQKPNPMAPKTMAAATPPTMPKAYALPSLAVLDRARFTASPGRLVTPGASVCNHTFGSKP